LVPELGRPPLTPAPPQTGQQQYGQEVPGSGQMAPPGMGGPQLDGPQQQGDWGQPTAPLGSQPLQPAVEDIPAQGQPTPAASAGALPPPKT